MTGRAGGVEDDMALFEEDRRPRSSMGESSSNTIMGSTTNELPSFEMTAGGLPKGIGPREALKDVSLSDSFDKDFVLIEHPSSITSMSQQSQTSCAIGCGHQSQVSSAILQPPTNHLGYLSSVSALIHQLALGKQDGGFPADALAALMLSLQVMDRVICLALHEPLGGKSVDVTHLQHHMNEVVQLSEDLSEKLGSSGGSSLPNMYEMVFQHALSFSRGAAADELMGNYARSQQLYDKALDLLWFLAEEAPQMELEPEIVLTPEENLRLQQYMATVISRRNACSSLSTC